MVIYLGSLVSRAVGREEHCKQISLVSVGSARSVSAALGLPLLTACVLSQSTLLRLPVALQGISLKGALGCVHFPGLSCSGSGSWVLHKGTDSGMHFVLFPGLSSSGDEVLGEHTVSGGLCILITSLVPASFPVCHKSAISGVLCVSSRELISGCNPPGRYQLSRIPRILV